MTGWHHRLNGHELGQTPRDSGGRRNLVRFIPSGQEESDRVSDWTTRYSSSATSTKGRTVDT